jgi:hypothetical protein
MSKRTNNIRGLASFKGNRDLAPAFLLHEKIHSQASFVLISSTFHPLRELFFCASPLLQIPAPLIRLLNHLPTRANLSPKHGLCK